MNAFPSSQPINRDSIGVKQNFGMSLRDYFAARAIDFCVRDSMLSEIDRAEEIRDAAILAYKIADAMMEARDERA